MKVLFIYPGYENLGIEYLSSHLKKNGHETKLIFDPMLFNEGGGPNNRFLSRIFSYKKKILKRVKKYDPDVVCFSVVTDNYFWAKEIASDIASLLKGVPKIFGGIHPTTMPDEVIKENFVDYICIGEGEKPLVELLECLDKDKEPKVNNVYYKKNGKIIKNKIGRYDCPDIETMPDKDLFINEFSGFKQEYSIITARGCPYDCSYCHNSFQREKGYRLRRRSVDNVISELVEAKRKYGIRFVRFEDEVFTYDKKWLKEFVVKYSKIPYFASVHPASIDEEVVLLLKKSGCIEVQLGVQTLNPKLLKDIGRVYSKESIKKCLRLFKKYKIRCATDNMFGLPGQKTRDLKELASFYNHNMPDIINVFWLKIYPKTKIELQMESKLDVKKGKFGYGAGGDTYNKKFAKYQTLFAMFHFFPKSIRSWLIRHVDVLPVFSPVFVTVFFRTFKKAKYDLQRSRMLRRYWKYGWRKITKF